MWKRLFEVEQSFRETGKGTVLISEDGIILSNPTQPQGRALEGAILEMATIVTRIQGNDTSLTYLRGIAESYLSDNEDGPLPSGA